MAAAGEASFITVFLNDGDGGLTASPTSVAWTGGQPQWIGIGDLTGDARNDLVITEFNPRESNALPAELLVNEGPAGFSAPIPIPGLTGTSFGGVVVADLNGDGLADLAGNTVDGRQLAVLLNLGDGGFSEATYPVPASPALIAIPGKDGPDLLVGNGGSPAFGAGQPGIQILKNDGRGDFQVGPKIPLPGGVFLATGDFNGDCIPDVVSGVFLNCGQVDWVISVLYGRSDGGFSPVEFLDAGGTAPAGEAPLGPVNSPRALGVVDDCVGGVQVFGNASR